MSYGHHQRSPHFAPPTFQPQPSWGGYDFFRAHAANPDRSLYDHAWSRVQDYSRGRGSQGVGKHEAKHFHRRAYGNTGELNHMLPSEIGHAAAYEAYHTWTHNSSMREPLSGDIERQREGLVGLAIAEATRLLQYSSRSLGSYGRMEATETAATTASIIFQQMMERGGGYGDHSRSRSRHGSFSSSSYGTPVDPYFGDTPRSHSRHRSSSHHRDYQDPYSSASAIPIPGTGVVVPTAYGDGAYGHHGSYGGAGMPMSGSPAYRSTSSVPMPISPSYHASPSMSLAVPVAHSRHRSTSMSVPYAPEYPAMMGQPQTVIMQPAPRSSHRHKHRHSHSHGRSRSSDPHAIVYGGGYSHSARY